MIDVTQLDNTAIFPDALLRRASAETGDEVEHSELPTEPPKDGKGFSTGGRPVTTDEEEEADHG